MFFRMLRQSILEGRRRKILAAVTVALAASLITALFELSVDVGDKMAREMKAYGANIRIVPKTDGILDGIGMGIGAVNPLSERDGIDESQLANIKDIFWRNNVIGFAPSLRTPVTVDGLGDVPLTGTWFDKPVALPSDEAYRTGVRVISPSWVVEGDWPDDQATDAVLAGTRLMARHGIRIGQSLRLAPTESDAPAAVVRVVGALTTGGSEDEGLTAPLPLAQTLAGLPGKVRAVDVSALTVPENALSKRARRNAEALSATEYDVWYCTAYVSTIAHQIEETVVNAQARPIWQVAAGEGAVIDKIQSLMLVVTLAAFVSAAMGVSSLMNTTITERAREIGLMKALGASDGQVHRLFLAEATVVGLVGGLMGGLTGLGLSQTVGHMVFGDGVAIHWIGFPVVILLSVLTVLAGSALPSRAIARLLPVEVLHGRR
ncbi:ABC transporter permease [Azospirillum doebereinerae]